MSGQAPKVSIGLPVYNGERFLADALDSILGQTFEDFEVIVSDNASTDGTAEIAREYAARDRRIRYTQTPHNLGSGPNFNRAYELSRGRYFRWAAHDDRTAPDFLDKCVEVLDARPEVVLCHTGVAVYDEDGRLLSEPSYDLAMDVPSPSRRLAELVLAKRHQCYEVFGLIRSSTLARTRWMGCYPVGDRVLLVELALRGPFHEIPERLFFSREHGGRSVRRLCSQQARAAWFDARYAGKITFPEWRQLTEYTNAIRLAPIDSVERARCAGIMLAWVRQYRKRMRRDLVVAAGEWLARKVEPAAASPG